MQSLRDKHAEEARGRQVKEEEMKAREDAVKNRDAELAELGRTQAAKRNRLEELEWKATAREADLDTKARVLAEDRVAFADLEKRSRKALKTLYEHGLEKPLDTVEDAWWRCLRKSLMVSVPWRRRKLASCLQLH